MWKDLVLNFTFDVQKRIIGFCEKEDTGQLGSQWNGSIGR